MPVDMTLKELQNWVSDEVIYLEAIESTIAAIHHAMETGYFSNEEFTLALWLANTQLREVAKRLKTIENAEVTK